MRRFTLLLVAALAAGCVGRKDAPRPMKLAAPAPPQLAAGEIRVFGHELPTARAEAVRKRLRDAEIDMLAQYEQLRHAALLEGGTVQLRIAVNRDGKVPSVVPIYSDLSPAIEERIVDVVEKLDFGPGPEAYAYDTLSFRADPFSVLKLRPDFDADPPVLLAEVQNQSTFRLRAVSVTVSVLGPDRARPLRVYRRRMEVDFPPGQRRTLRVPVGSEWATGANTFLVDVAPALPTEQP